jgi:hypothetical protein
MNAQLLRCRLYSVSVLLVALCSTCQQLVQFGAVRPAAVCGGHGRGRLADQLTGVVGEEDTRDVALLDNLILRMSHNVVVQSSVVVPPSSRSRASPCESPEPWSRAPPPNRSPVAGPQDSVCSH